MDKTKNDNQYTRDRVSKEEYMNDVNTAAAISSTKEEQLRKLVFAGIFAAITYVVFTFLSIPIPTIAGDKVTVHLGNAFCVLGALILGSAYGGVGGALGLTIADLIDPVYTQARTHHDGKGSGQGGPLDSGCSCGGASLQCSV